MKHCIAWTRDTNQPCIVTYLRGMELDRELFNSLGAALVRLATLNGW